MAPRVDFQPLCDLYAGLARVVRRNGSCYPAATEQGERLASRELLTVERGSAQPDRALADAGKAHLEELAARTPDLHDGAILALRRLERTGQLRAVESSYFAMLATCDALRAEYLEAAASGEVDAPSLARRALAHQAAGGDPLRSGAGRAAAIGLSVLVTVPCARGRAALLGRRRDDVALDRGLWHIAPSGMLEPSGTGSPALRTALEELREEVGVSLDDRPAPEDRLSAMGIGHDLLRLRPEICLRLDLSAREVAPGGVRLSADEFADQQLVELSREGLDAFWRAHPADALTPAAAAALALAEDALP